MDDEKNDAPVPGQDSVEPETKGLDAAEQTELRDDTPMDAPADTGSDAEPTPEETVKMPAADASDSSGVSEPKTDPVPKDSSKSPTDVLKRIPKWGYAVAAVVIVALLFASHTICFHDWRDATCTVPRTCSICGRTDGDPLGHDWQDATCSEPKTCKRCGEKEGDPLGHQVDSWTTDKEASCTEEGSASGKCVRCGKAQTKSLPRVSHTYGDWVVDTPATCVQKGSQTHACSVCGYSETQEIPLADHTEGEWEVAAAPTISKSGTVTPGEKTLTCSVCGKILKTEKIDLEVTASQKNALGSAQSYLRFMAFSYSGLVHQLEYEGYSNADATFAADYCGADWNEQAAKSAESYLKYMSFSRSSLIHQLEYEGFTADQATYGADAVGL